jgi:CheY-like chemotaxis protein/anti-sigma regulatory factor (Ser/Thr protein kinase)
VRGMGRLLDDLLDVSRMTQKKFQVQKESIELSTIVERCRVSTESLMRSKKQVLVIDLPPAPTHIDVDPLRFEQILVNLLNNAAKYSPEGSQIALTATVDSDMLCFSVRDQGIGMSKDMFEKIFEPFRQLNPSRSGLGIGLAVAKRLVELHGGTVEVRSEGAGKGSTFTVRIPLPKAQTLLLPHQEKTVTNGSPKFNILLVDDNEAAAQALSKLLEYRGHIVTNAESGEKALELAAGNPDIIILDIGLPGMDGYEVARKLRASKSKAMLVALSGYGQDDDKLHSKESGFDAHLTKPIALSDLENIFATLSVRS